MPFKFVGAPARLLGGHTSRLFHSSAFSTLPHYHNAEASGPSASSPAFDSSFVKEHFCSGVGLSLSDLITHAKGSYMYTNTGAKILDFGCGIGVTNLGHCHPDVVNAAKAALDQCFHMQVSMGVHQHMYNLVHKLLPKVAPIMGGDARFFFWNSGAEAIEAAVKVARMYTGRPNVITFKGSYHGRTIATMAMNKSKQIYSARFGPSMPGIYAAPFPVCGASCGCNAGCVSVDKAIKELKELLVQQSDPADTACIVVEPVQGEGGYIPAPPAFLSALRQLCDETGILLVADEVQTGYGRTGTMFACEQFQGKPDILVIAKGIANGLPLSAIVTRQPLMQKMPPGSMGGTYAGNFVSCAAACAVIDVFDRDNILSNVQARGKQLSAGLRKIASCHLGPKGIQYDVRGPGCMVGFEAFGLPKGGPWHETAITHHFPWHLIAFTHVTGTYLSKELQKAALKHNLMLLTCGNDTIRFIPPLTVTADEMDEGLQKVDAAMHDVVKKL